MRVLVHLLLLGRLAGLVLLAGLVSACDGPCRALAERICECEFNARERAACIQEIDSNGNVRQPTAEEDEQCSVWLETCDCDKLERQDLAACGLTKRRDPSL